MQNTFNGQGIITLGHWLNITKDIKQRTPARLDQVADATKKLCAFSNRAEYREWVKQWKQVYKEEVEAQVAAKRLLRQPHPTVIINGWKAVDNNIRSTMSNAAFRASRLTAMLHLRRYGKRMYPSLVEGEVIA